MIGQTLTFGLVTFFLIQAATSTAQANGGSGAAIVPTVAVATPSSFEASDGSRASSDDTEAAAAEEYHRTGVARIVRTGAYVSYPYGHSQPVVTCAPLRACVIELEAGESVLSKIGGDTQRWEIEVAAAGSDGRTPLVVTKPHDCNISTNLILSTTKGRIYDLMLDSPPCPHSRDRDGRNPQGEYERHVRFWYPDSTVEEVTRPAANPTPAPVTVAPTVESFNFDYKIDRDKHFPWNPTAVFDDGTRCFIKLPSQAQHSEAPVLFTVAEDGTKTLLNYVVRGDTYVTDRVFHRAILVLGDGGTQQSVRLENKRAASESR